MKTRDLLIWALKGIETVNTHANPNLHSNAVAGNTANCLEELAAALRRGEKMPKIEYYGNEQPHKRAVFVVE